MFFIVERDSQLFFLAINPPFTSHDFDINLSYFKEDTIFIDDRAVMRATKKYYSLRKLLYVSVKKKISVSHISRGVFAEGKNMYFFLVNYSFWYKKENFVWNPFIKA